LDLALRIGQFIREEEFLVFQDENGEFSVCATHRMLAGSGLGATLILAISDWVKQFVTILDGLIISNVAPRESVTNEHRRAWQPWAYWLHLPVPMFDPSLFHPLPKKEFRGHSLLMQREYTGKILEFGSDCVTVRWTSGFVVQTLTRNEADLAGFQNLGVGQSFIAKRIQHSITDRYVWTSDAESLGFDVDEDPSEEEAAKIVDWWLDQAKRPGKTRR
jgi:hypothetical protein